ncbi:MAG: RHS repeat-associated core domain-containing protein [Lachnospiraceae bacterium]
MSDFGETSIHGSSALKNEIYYTGGIYDESTGLYYLNARYYDPKNGRFLTEDTYRGEVNDPDTFRICMRTARTIRLIM